MSGKTFSKFVKQLPATWLPFADVTSAGLPMSRLLRLSLFKFTMGITTALMIGTLNRVMIVELFVPAWLVALMRNLRSVHWLSTIQSVIQLLLHQLLKLLKLQKYLKILSA